MTLELARRDMQNYNSMGWSTEISIKPNDAAAFTIITGFATKHHLSIDTDGMPVNSKNAHVSLNETILTAAGYTVRNANLEVALIDHIVSYADSSGVIKLYKISEVMPDETLGQITCFLVDYE